MLFEFPVIGASEAITTGLGELNADTCHAQKSVLGEPACDGEGLGGGGLALPARRRDAAPPRRHRVVVR